MPSDVRKQQRAAEKAQKEEQHQQALKLLAQAPNHDALTVTVDGGEITLKIDVNFKKSSSISLVGKEESNKEQSEFSLTLCFLECPPCFDGCLPKFY